MDKLILKLTQTEFELINPVTQTSIYQTTAQTALLSKLRKLAPKSLTIQLSKSLVHQQQFDLPIEWSELNNWPLYQTLKTEFEALTSEPESGCYWDFVLDEQEHISLFWTSKSSIDSILESLTNQPIKITQLSLENEVHLNLLPWRKHHHQQRRRQLYVALSSLLITLVLTFAGGLAYAHQQQNQAKQKLITFQQQLSARQNQLIQQKQLQNQLKQAQKEWQHIQKLEQQSLSWQKQIKVVLSAIPNGVVIQNWQQTSKTIQLKGKAKTALQLRLFIQKLQRDTNIKSVKQNDDAWRAFDLSLVFGKAHAR